MRRRRSGIDVVSHVASPCCAEPARAPIPSRHRAAAQPRSRALRRRWPYETDTRAASLRAPRTVRPFLLVHRAETEARIPSPPGLGGTVLIGLRFAGGGVQPSMHEAPENPRRSCSMQWTRSTGPLGGAGDAGQHVCVCPSSAIFLLRSGFSTAGVRRSVATELAPSPRAHRPAGTRARRIQPQQAGGRPASRISLRRSGRSARAGGC